MSSQALTWSLVIATYNREHILPRCLRLAARQTRGPKEIVVVDASPDWEVTRSRLSEEFAQNYAAIPLYYLQAIRPSLTAQRNQGIDFATGDILFLIDDDSLMYPDCAEQIMAIYEADVDHAIQGVSAIQNPVPPDAEEVASDQAVQQGVVAVRPKETWLRQFVKSLLATEQTYFLPYDEDYPHTPIPNHLHAYTIGQIQVMAGYSMTFRRSVLQKERFSEVLLRYAAGEDQDLSYRVSRHGALVNAVNAQLCHLEISGGRLSLFKVIALAVMNPAVLQRLHSPNISMVRQKWQKIVWQRVMINFLKDFSERKFHFSRTRGVLYGLRQLSQIYRQTPEELLQWYPQFQADFLSK